MKALINQTFEILGRDVRKFSNVCESFCSFMHTNDNEKIDSFIAIAFNFT